MDRRSFLEWVGVGMLASSLPIVIAACSSNQSQANSQPSSPVGGGSFQPVGTTAELKQKGSLLIKKSGAKPILVIANPQNPTQVVAVNPTCTHQGCLVNWQAKDKAFVCPCHQARFNAQGKVAGGPTQKDLTTYTTKVEGNRILVKA